MLGFFGGLRAKGLGFVGLGFFLVTGSAFSGKCLGVQGSG